MKNEGIRSEKKRKKCTYSCKLEDLVKVLSHGWFVSEEALGSSPPTVKLR